MASLKDIVAPPRTIRLGDHEIEYRGLTIRQIADLLARFERLRVQLAEADGKTTLLELAARVGPEVCAAIIAAGTGQPEADAANLGFAHAVDLIDAILVETGPRGAGPLANELRALVGGGAASLSRPTQAPS